MDKEFENSFERTSKIELAIDDIFDFIENCKMQAFSATKVIVPKDEMYELIDELRRKTPEEVGRCRKMLKNRNEIIRDAREKAAAILEDAREQYNAMVQEHVVVQEAIQQAENVRVHAETEMNQMVQNTNAESQRILREAKEGADQIYAGAVIYAEDMLNMLQSIMEKTFHDAHNEYSSLLNSLKSNIEIVKENREELRPQEVDLEGYGVQESEEGQGVETEANEENSTQDQGSLEPEEVTKSLASTKEQGETKK